jgi:hypothetical protein
LLRCNEEGDVNNDCRHLLLSLFLLRCSAAKKATTVWLLSPSSIFFLARLQLSEEGDGNCRRLCLLVLLRCNATEEGAFFL